MDNESAMRILRDIRVKGRLDYGMVMRTIFERTGGTRGSFFQLVTHQFACKYSSDRSFSLDKWYSYDDIPENQHSIVIGSDTIAIICCDDAPNDAGEEEQGTLFHDIISVGVVLTRARESGNALHLSVCNELGQLLSSALNMLGSLPSLPAARARLSRESALVVQDYTKVISQHLASMSRIITQALALIYDVRDYIAVDQGMIIVDAVDVVVRDLLNEVIETHQDKARRSITVNMHERVPRTVRCSQTRLKQVLDSVMVKLADIGSVGIEVDSQPGGADAITLNIRFRTLSRLDQWFSYEMVTAKTLSTALISRLCVMMNGKLEVEDDGLGVLLSFKCGLPKTVEAFTNKQILICAADPALQTLLFSLLTEWGAAPQICGVDPELYIAHIERFHMVLSDSSFAAFVPRIRKKGVAVLGLLSDSGLDRSFQYNYFDATVSLPFAPSELSDRCKQLLRV
jgi:hypothetical protein